MAFDWQKLFGPSPTVIPIYLLNLNSPAKRNNNKKDVVSCQSSNLVQCKDICGEKRLLTRGKNIKLSPGIKITNPNPNEHRSDYKTIPQMKIVFRNLQAAVLLLKWSNYVFCPREDPSTTKKKCFDSFWKKTLAQTFLHQPHCLRDNCKKMCHCSYKHKRILTDTYTFDKPTASSVRSSCFSVFESETREEKAVRMNRLDSSLEFS